MNEQPQTVVCTSCSAKFHVPDDLIRGKLVKFRCRKCGEAIEVDGRKSARPPAATPPPAAEITAVDTPATFSQRTLPPPRPPTVPTKSSPSMHPWPEPPIHPWPEPPRSRSTTAPTAISPSTAPEEMSGRFEAVRDPSNRGPKIAAVVALFMAAGLSGIGLAMRNTPGASPGILVHGMPSAPPGDPADPAPARAAAPKEGDPSRSGRTPTRVTDLPVAVDGVEPPLTAEAPTPKPGDLALEKKDPPPAHDEPPAAAAGQVANNTAAPLPALPAAPTLPAEPDEPPSNTPPPPGIAPAAAANAPPANPPNAPVAVATPPAAAPPSPPPPVAQPTPAPNPAPAPPPALARTAKGDFNTQAAREALEDAASRAAKCKTIDSPSGTARVAVTFAPNGQATNAVIESGPFVGTAAGTCVASKFRTARVPAFSGESVQVHKSIPLQ
jgi:predicted Zn finger-like uncharacterized protein